MEPKTLGERIGALRREQSMRWLKPVTPEGRAGLDAYRAEEAD